MRLSKKEHEIKIRKCLLILQGMELPRNRVYHLSQALPNCGFIPIIITSKFFDSRDSRRPYDIKEFILPILLKRIPVLFPRQLLLNFLVIPIIALLESPDIILISVPDGSPLLPTFISSKILKKKLIIDIRDEWEEDIFNALGRVGSLIKKMIYSIYSNANALIVVTPSFLRKYKVLNSNTSLIFQGVDTDLFRPLPFEEVLSIKKTLGFTPDDFVIAYVGKLSPPYRLDIVLMALRILILRGRKKVKLLIVGKSGEKTRERIRESEIISIANKLGIKDMVKVLPFTHQTKLAKYLGIADAGIIPYDHNPLWKNTIATKFYEYCACGLPVIVTAYKDSILAKIIDDNKIGLVCDPLDAEKLANTIEKLIEDESFRKKAGTMARTLIEKEFSKEKLAERFINVIFKVLRENG